MVPESMLLRYRYPDGRVQAALPLYVVEKTPGAVVGWLASGSHIAYWCTADGSDPRTIPLDQRFRQLLGSGPRRWLGNAVLRVIPADQCWQVLHFWDEATGGFRGWYVNLESTKHVEGETIDATDWYLDLLISPSFVVTWKDADEAAAAAGTRYLRHGDLQTARNVGEGIAANPQRLIEKIGDWRTFEPQTTWGPLSLPDRWNQATA